MAGPFASPLFHRLAGRGALFRGFHGRWVSHFALSLTRCLTVCDATTCPRENPQSEFSRPCDNLSCLFFTALWLQRSQSIMVQEIRPAKDIDLTCFKTLPIKATTCLQVDPCPWIGQRIQLQDSSNPDLRSLPKFPATINNETLFQLPHVPVGDRILFKHHCKNHSVLQVGIHVAISLMEVCDVFLGTLGVSLGRFFPRR